MHSSIHRNDMQDETTSNLAGERGYPLFTWNMSQAKATSLLTVALTIGIGGALYVWYSRTGGDPFPDSTVGLGYATTGTLCLILAAALYSLRRRARRRGIGQLNAALQWHIAFAITGLALLFMHSFGHFNPRSGTYALYGMIALVLSGVIGKILDALLPRLIAQEAQKALTAQDDDRISTISRKLQDIVSHNSQEIRAYHADGRGNSLSGISNYQSSASSASINPPSLPLLTSWDMAYISLEETPQELSRTESHYRFVPDKQSGLTQPGALLPGAQAHIKAIADAQKALRREQCYRYIIRYWRVLHVGLALLTVGLTIWHIIYAAQLLLPVLLHK